MLQTPPVNVRAPTAGAVGARIRADASQRPERPRDLRWSIDFLPKCSMRADQSQEGKWPAPLGLPGSLRCDATGGARRPPGIVLRSAPQGDWSVGNSLPLKHPNFDGNINHLLFPAYSRGYG